MTQDTQDTERVLSLTYTTSSTNLAKITFTEARAALGLQGTPDSELGDRVALLLSERAVPSFEKLASAGLLDCAANGGTTYRISGMFDGLYQIRVRTDR